MWARGVVFAVALAICSTSIAQTQQSPTQRDLAPQSQALQPTLIVRTTNGQATFHIGERIPLTLTFTCPGEGHFYIAPWESERGEEFGDFEDFTASPASGSIDPLREYFDGRSPMTGHGWSWPPFVAEKPVTVNVDLNQWVRFEAPGDYSVRITSHRIAPANGSSPLEISSVLQLHIVAAPPEWQKERLRRFSPTSKVPPSKCGLRLWRICAIWAYRERLMRLRSS